MASGFENSASSTPTAVAGTSSQPFNPFGGLPFGPWGAMAVQMMTGSYALNQFGMMPFGVGSQQNIYDRMMLSNVTEMNQRLMVEAATRDARVHAEMLRGAAAASGVIWTAKEFNESIRTFETAAPIIGASIATGSEQNALKIDADMYGGRSSAVFRRFFGEGARYAVDPFTGKRGMSEASLQQIGGAAYSSLFEGSDRGSLMKGLTAGEAGLLSGALQRQGLGPNMAGLDMQDVQGDAAAMRNIQKDKIVANIRNYAGALSAIKEIFGELGKTGTMSEMINALEQISGGGMSQISPQRLELTARQFRNTSFNAGIQMPVALMMLQRATEVSQSMGMNPMFATEATMGTFGFLGAVNQQGLGAPMWGLSNQMQLGAMDTNLRLSAIKSPLANNLGALSRMGAAVGGLTGQGGKVLEMLNKGDVAGLSGMLERGELSQRAVMDMMVRGSGGRINEAQAISAFRATDANTENIFQGGFGGTVRQMQGADIFRTRITPAISNALMESGISQEKAMGLAERISMRLRETPRETLATPELRNAAMSRILREEGVAGDARKLGGISETMWSQMTSMVQDQLKSYGSLANLFAEHDPRATRGGAAQVQEATKQSLIQSALAGVGQGGVMQRMLQTLGSSEMGKDPEAIKKLLLKSLGYEDIGKAGAKQPLKSELEAVEKASGALARIGEIKEQITARTADVTKRLTDAFGHGTAEEIKRLTEERENITKSYSAEIAEQTKILESDQSKGMVEKIKERAKEEAKLKDTAEGKVTPEEKLTKMVITGTLDVDADGKGKLSATGTSDGPAASPIA